MGGIAAELRPQVLAAMRAQGFPDEDVLVWTGHQHQAEAVAACHGDLAVVPITLPDGAFWVLALQMTRQGQRPRTLRA